MKFNSADSAHAAAEQAEQCRRGGLAFQELAEHGAYSARVGACVYATAAVEHRMRTEIGLVSTAIEARTFNTEPKDGA